MKELYSIITRKDKSTTFIHDIKNADKYGKETMKIMLEEDVILSDQRNIILIGECGTPSDRIPGVKPKSFEEVMGWLKRT